MANIFIGLDPGGKRKYGISILKERSLVLLDVCSSVDEMIQKIRSAISDMDTICAVGVDSPLSWSTNSAGWRRVDEVLRLKYPEFVRSVVSINSLRGSALVGGVAGAKAIIDTFSHMLCSRFSVSESHPKLLIKAKEWQNLDPIIRSYSWELGDFSENLSNFDWYEDGILNDDDKRDSFISLVFAYESWNISRSNWVDLSSIHGNSNLELEGLLGKKPVYMWFESINEL